jgi:hypothetical protein
LLVFSRFADEPFDGEQLADVDLAQPAETGAELRVYTSANDDVLVTEQAIATL